jgi:hypothetical protein
LTSSEGQIRRVRVVYVVGSSHSGSTLLAMLADQHPLVASVGETAVKRQIRRDGRATAQECSCGAVLEECAFWRGVFDDVSASGVRLSARRWRTDYRFEHPFADALLTKETSMLSWRTARKWATRHAPILRTRMARVDRANLAFVRAVLARRRAAVFLDTTKLLTRLTYLLDLPEMDIRVVRLVRDVRGFAASARRRGGSVTEAAKVWVNDQIAIDRVLARQSSVPSLLVRYEDVCGAPATTLRDLWEFCGVPAIGVSSVVRSREHHVLGNRMRMNDVVEVRLDESWRSRLDSSDQLSVLRIAGTLNDRMGYARA